MRNASYVRVSEPAEASRILAELGTGASLLVGGTDLIPLIKDDLATPEHLIDLSGWTAGRGIEARGGLVVIGALTPLSVIADDARIQNRFTALSEACKRAATPQLRNMGTLGGNLLQQTRCWYFRSPLQCWMKGGESCLARQGENEYHSIFATDTCNCVSAHPSDPAAALFALNARLRYVTGRGEEEIGIEELFALPEDGRRTYTRLPENAVLTAVVLDDSMPLRSTYAKAMARASWAFALAGVAISTEDGPVLRGVQVALSGVAPIPWRARQVEAALQGLQRESVPYDEISALVAEGARPLSHNGYKETVLRGIFKEALEAICRGSS